MNLLDSSGWIEIFAGTERAGLFIPALQKGELLVPSIVIYEVRRYVLNHFSAAFLPKVMAALHSFEIVELTGELAANAADEAKRLKLAMADASIYATAQMYSATIWSQDADLGRLPGVKYFPKEP